MIEKITFESSNLKFGEYNTDREELSIGFHSGGIYKYFFVPQRTFYLLSMADSKGKFFAENIKKTYKFLKIK